MSLMGDNLTVSEVREAKQTAEDEIAAAVRRTLDELRDELGTEADWLSVSLKTVTKTDGSEHVVGVDVDLSLDI
jgi:molybdopterin converting factor small subunit